MKKQEKTRFLIPPMIAYGKGVKIYKGKLIILFYFIFINIYILYNIYYIILYYISIVINFSF